MERRKYISTFKRIPLKKTLSLVSTTVVRDIYDRKHKLSLDTLLPRISEGNNIFKESLDVDTKFEEIRKLSLVNKVIDKDRKRSDAGKSASRYKDRTRDDDKEPSTVMAYLHRETKRRTELLQSLKISELMQMEAEKEREIYKYYNDSSFYSLHILLRYQSDQLSNSYIRPSTRVGYSGRNERLNNKEQEHVRKKSNSSQRGIMKKVGSNNRSSTCVKRE